MIVQIITKNITRELAQFACPVFGVQVSSYSHPWGHSALLVTRDRVSRRRAKIYGYRERRVEVRHDELKGDTTSWRITEEYTSNGLVSNIDKTTRWLDDSTR